MVSARSKRIGMDVLIKGYNMPKCCNDCAFHKKGNIIKSIENGDVIYKIIIRCEICKAEDPYMSYKDADTKRRDDCPLVEILPHGRLVDADKLIQYMEERQERLNDDRALWELSVVDTFLSDAPTVIEGEKE